MGYRNLTLCALALFVILTVLAAPPATTAKTPEYPEWFQPSESDWNVGEDTAREIHNACMLFESVVFDEHDVQDGDVYTILYRRIRVFSEDGRDESDVTLPYLNSSQKIKRLRARVILRDGTIIEMPKENVHVREVVKTKDFKIKEHSFSMPGVTSDCIIEYQVVFQTDYIVTSWMVQKDIVLLSGEYRWLLGQFDINQATAVYYGGMDAIEAMLTPNYLWLNQTNRPNIEKLPDIKETKEIRFTTFNVPRFKDEPYSLPDAAIRERLIKYYGSNASPAGYWSDEAQEESKRCRDFCEKDKRVKELAERFNQLETEWDKIDAAYKFCQDSILNLSYNDLYEDAERTKKADPKDRKDIDDVLKYRYGSSRQIDLLFWDLLMEMNIESTVGRFCNRSEDLLIRAAKYWQFDNTIVGIPTKNGGYLFISPGHAFTPIGMCPWYAEGVDVLLANSDVNFATAPFSKPDASAAVLSHAYQVDEDMNVFGEVAGKIDGHTARTLRLDIHDLDAEHRAADLTETLDKLYSVGEVDSVTFENLDDISQPFVVNFNLKFAPLTEVGGRVMLKPCSYLSDSENPFTSEERLGAVLFKYAHKDTESLQITLPEDWEIEGLPPDTSFTNKVGECHISYTSFGTTITVQRLFVLNSPFWAVENYPDVRAFYQFVQDASDQIAVVRLP